MFDYITIAKYATLGAGGIMFAWNLLPRKIKVEEQLHKAFLASKLYVKHEKDVRLTPTMIKKKRHKSGYSISYAVPPGLSLNDFIKAKEKLEFAVNAELDMWSENNSIKLNIMTDRLPSRVNLTDELLKEILAKLSKIDLGFPIGASKSGFIYGDFDKCPHWRIAGFTRSGKSVFIRLIITLMHLAYNTAQKPKVLFKVIDLKEGVEFQWLNGIKYAESAETEDAAVKMLQSLNKELTRRAKLLKERKAVNLAESKLDLPCIVVVIDEYAELEDNDEAHKLVNRLFRMGAFAGIFVIPCSQRLDANVFPGAEKANAPGVVCFRVTDDIDSMVMLKNTAAARLPEIKGRAIYKLSRQREIQVPFISREQAEKLLAQYRVDEIVHDQKEAVHESEPGVL